MSKNNMTNNSRRRFLQGTGATVALPFLEVFASPAQACGQVNPRFIAIYMPNGVTQDDFFSIPGGEGSKYAYQYLDWRKNGKDKKPIVRTGSQWNPASIVRPYVDDGLKSKIAVYNHLSNQNLASANAGQTHASAACTFLTCQGGVARKSPIQMGGQSFDHFIANHYSGSTSLRSMHLSSGIKHGSGNGSHTTYSNTLTWDSAGKPIQPYISPRDAFAKYFGNAVGMNVQPSGPENQTKSVLDFVIEDATDLRTRLGQTDKERLDEYLTSVREIEKSIQSSGTGTSIQCDIANQSYPHYVTVSSDSNPPNGYSRPDHMQMNFDMMYVALKCGLTNVATYLMEEERAEFVWPKGISGSGADYHGISHRYPDVFSKLNRYLSGHASKFLKRLDDIKESNGLSMLDNSVAMVGSGMNGPVYYPTSRDGAGDPGHDHQRYALPIVFAGSGGGKLKTHQEVCFPPDTHYANVFQTLATHVYCTPQKKFANSTKVINEMLV